MRGMKSGTLAGFVVAVFALGGCGGNDDKSGTGGRTAATPTATTPAATATTAVPPTLSGEAAEAAKVVAEFLDAPSGADACISLVGTQYADSLGGQGACAKQFDPLVTGPYNRIASVRIVKPGTEAAADVTAAKGGRPVVLKLARATTGWRINGAAGLPS
jgi:hypothetical protein